MNYHYLYFAMSLAALTGRAECPEDLKNRHTRGGFDHYIMYKEALVCKSLMYKRPFYQ